MPPERKPNWLLFMASMSMALALPFDIQELNLMVEITPRLKNIPLDVWEADLAMRRFFIALKGFSAIALFYAFTSSQKTEEERRYGLTDGIAMAVMSLLWFAVYVMVRPKHIWFGVWLLLMAWCS